MFQWNAKVHKSGTKVAIFNGSKLVKSVESSKDTFEPAEAQKFAEELLKELNSKTSAQMTEPSQQPTIATEAEIQNSSLAAVAQQATGKGAGDVAPVVAPVVEEEDADAVVEEGEIGVASSKMKEVIANLKRKLSQERNDRLIERKARRGLAIAKQMVIEGNLEDSYDSIKAKVADIVKLEDSEIERLERKVAGEHEFESIEDAQKEVRRQARISRINRQAAAEAQEDLDVNEADSLDKLADLAEAKMAHVQSVIEEMKKAAEEKPAEEAAEKPAEEAAEKPAKEAAEKPAEKAPVVPAEKPAEEMADAPVVPVVEKEEKKEDKLASLAREYRSIAANHRKLAEKSETEGDVKTADIHDSMADQAEEKAEELEKKIAVECCDAPVATDAKTEDDEDADPAEGVEAPELAEQASRQPGMTVTSSEHKPLKREGSEVIEEFGIDKNASLVEQNDYSTDPEVEVLSKMWRGAEKDE